MKKILMLLGVLLLLTSCSNNPSVKKGEYISFTYTYGYQDGFLSDVYYYDINRETLKKITTVPHTSNYPITVYDANRNMVYYQKQNTVNGVIYDDVYQVDLVDGSEKKITTGLVGTNYMVPMKDGLFHVSLDVKVNNDQLLPFFYNFSDESTTLLKSPTDHTIKDISYNVYTNKLATSSHNEPEYYQLMLNQINVDLIAPENQLMIYDDIFEEPRHLVTTQEKRVVSIGLFQNHLESMDFSNLEDITQDKILTTTVDLDGSTVVWDEKIGFDDLGSYIGTNQDESKLYFLDPDGSLGVYDYDKEEVEWIFTSSAGSSMINNAIMLRKDWDWINRY